MKKLVTVLFGLAAVFIFFSCQQKKEEKKEIYINPVFKENLSEVYDIISKRYILEYDDLLKRFGAPVKKTIDSVQSETNEALFDSTFVLAYDKVSFHYYKRTSDKKVLFTGVDLTGDFKGKQFILKSGAASDEIILLFGDPSRTDEKGNSIEFSYPLYKDEEGKSYDTLIFVFVEDKLVGINYVPYIDIYPDTTDEQQQ
jgi:hypothetical protein